MSETFKIEAVQMLDVTAPKLGVQVEYDKSRKVLYVHIDGITALRICRIPWIRIQKSFESRYAEHILYEDGEIPEEKEVHSEQKKEAE